MVIEKNTVLTTVTRYIRVPKDPPELLGCPCCGARAVYKSLHAVWAECVACGLSTPAYTDVDMVAKAWNGNILAIKTGHMSERGGSIVGLQVDRDTIPKNRRLAGYMDFTPNEPKRGPGRPRKPNAKPKYTPTGRPPGRPRKYPKPDTMPNSADI